MPTLDIQIASSGVSSKVVVANGALRDVTAVVDASRYSSVHILADASVTELANAVAAQLGTSHITIIEGAELQKSFEGVENVCRNLMEQGADRKSLLVSIGGGATGDLGGFAASIYMRGIENINIATSLLAQIDASIGGKTGINAFGVKNSIGSFMQPKVVIIDPETLASLSDRDIASGFAEILKHGLIEDKKLWQELSATSAKELLGDLERLESIIFRSCQIKQAVVERDEREGGERKKLNFGHTIGHALESLSHETNKPYLHGEAVALGMIVEAKLSDVSAEEYKEILRVLAAYGLPSTDWTESSVNDIVAHTKTDKKASAGTVKWTLLSGIGSSVFDKEIDDEAVAAAIKEIT